VEPARLRIYPMLRHYLSQGESDLGPTALVSVTWKAGMSLLATVSMHLSVPAGAARAGSRMTGSETELRLVALPFLEVPQANHPNF
jgi:hypothetical protein